MDRQDISPEQQALIDIFKVEQGATFDEEIAGETNIVEGDDLEIDGSWKARVIAGQWGCVACLVPAFGDAIMSINLVPYVTDRAGPNGETMPIYDPPGEDEPGAPELGGEGGAP